MVMDLVAVVLLLLDVKNAFTSADWSRINATFVDIDVSRYIASLVENNFLERTLLYGANEVPKEYAVTAKIP